MGPEAGEHLVMASIAIALDSTPPKKIPATRLNHQPSTRIWNLPYNSYYLYAVSCNPAVAKRIIEKFKYFPWVKGIMTISLNNTGENKEQRRHNRTLLTLERN